MTEEIFYRSRGYDEYYKRWHTSGRNMIIYMHSDGGSLVCGERSFPIRRGALCFVGSTMYHYTMPESPENYVRSKIFETNEELGTILPLIYSDRERSTVFNSEALIYALIPEEEYAKVDSLFADVYSSKNSAKYRAIRIGAYIRLLAYIEEYRLEAISPESNFLHRAIDYINAHVTEDIKIEDICDTVHVSKYHFCREFKKRTGKTVMEYILATRIVLAKGMLQKTAFSIGEISERCGFSSISYFCRVFKQDTNKTPLRFRKEANI